MTVPSFGRSLRFAFTIPFHPPQWPTFPQVYINGEFFGGADIVMASAQVGLRGGSRGEVDATD